jgi:hypothetical protein
MTTTKVKAYATQSAVSALAPFGLNRREPGPQEVDLEMPAKLFTHFFNGWTILQKFQL